MRSVKLIFLLTISPYLFANEARIFNLYKSYGIEGTLLIRSQGHEIEHRHNSKKVDLGYIPASTFKIPNTLIALEEGIIKDEFERIKWDGVKREYASWNKDQTLKSAFSISCVWCYQRFAQSIGDSKYREYLGKFDYGNHKTGQDVTTFWLEGNLRTSVRDQINFLKKVYAEDLPLQKRSYSILKDIMLSEETETYKIWSKTGWAGKDGWYVGYLEIGNKVWFFANHIEIRSKSDLELRRKLTLEAFKILDII